MRRYELAFRTFLNENMKVVISHSFVQQNIQHGFSKLCRWLCKRNAYDHFVLQIEFVIIARFLVFRFGKVLMKISEMLISKKTTFSCANIERMEPYRVFTRFRATFCLEFYNIQWHLHVNSLIDDANCAWININNVSTLR